MPKPAKKRPTLDHSAQSSAGTAVNVRGGSRDPNRGTWRTPLTVATAIGPFDLDPFSNPRSHIVSAIACMLERGDDGFGTRDSRFQEPGSYFIANSDGPDFHEHPELHAALVPALGMRGRFHVAASATRTFLQPPYSIVLRALRHYLHTRWCALLRFDPRPEWFDVVYDASELVCVLREIEFEPPPGVPKGGGNSFPHALFYRRAEDVTPEVLAMSIAWRKRPRT